MSSQENSNFSSFIMFIVKFIFGCSRTSFTFVILLEGNLKFKIKSQDT